MLAEYFIPLPTAMACTLAVCTGSGSVAAAFSCLHAAAPSMRALARAAGQRQFRTAAAFIGSLFPQRFLKFGLCIPEGKQAFFIIVVGGGNGGLLLQHIAQQHRGMFKLIADFSQLLIGRVP